MTPQSVKDRAYEARISINQLLKNAGVSTTFMWRWEGGSDPHPITLHKVREALEQAEAGQ